MKVLNKILIFLISMLVMLSIYLFLLGSENITFDDGILLLFFFGFGWVIPASIMVIVILRTFESIILLMTGLFFVVLIFFITNDYIHSTDPSKGFLLLLSMLIFWLTASLMVVIKFVEPKFVKWMKSN